MLDNSRRALLDIRRGEGSCWFRVHLFDNSLAGELEKSMILKGVALLGSVVRAFKSGPRPGITSG